MLALYGHPFSSYTWKVLIALYANATPFEFRIVDGDHPEHATFVAKASPLGKFPVLRDGARMVIESTAIIEWLHLHHPGPAPLLPGDAEESVEVRMIDRVFDNYVMGPTQEIVAEHIRSPGSTDPALIGREQQRLERSYRWLEYWLQRSRPGGGVTLVECAAAPALFYADWVHPIPSAFDRLRRWRSRLLALPPVARCVDEARPWRHLFPPGAPDRD